MDNSEHLQWLHDRIINVYGESENVDFLHRFRDIIEEVKNSENTIAKQDLIIGKQYREILQFEETQRRLNECNAQRKREAGYDQSVSFDDVWAETLRKARSFHCA